MAETPNTNKDPNLKDLEIIELKVEINKDLPATPGDKEVSRIITVPSKKLPDAIERWTEVEKSPAQPAESKEDTEDTVICKGKKKLGKLTSWPGEKAITIVKPHVNDIVPSAGFPDPPQWQVIVKIWDDQLPKAPPPPKDQNPQATPRVRVNVLLSFDTERYMIFPYGKWPKDDNQRKDDTKEGSHKSKDVNQRKAATTKRIYQAIFSGDKEIIKYFILKRYIQTSRLPLDDIREGEWFLPIFIDKSGSKEKQFLAYVKVVIEWKSNGRKAAATPAAETAATPAAGASSSSTQQSSQGAKKKT